MKWLNAILYVIVVLLLVGCTETAQTTTTTTTTTTMWRTVGDLEVLVWPQSKIYDQGEDIFLSISVKNNGATTYEMYLPTAQTCDFVVSQGGTEIWRDSKSRVYPQVQVRVAIDPNGIVTYGSTWEQEDNSQNPVAAGDYDLTGYLGFYGSTVYGTGWFTIR